MAGPDKDNAGAGAKAPALSAGAGDPFGRTDPPVFQLHLEPHRSLSRKGFGWVIGFTTVGLALPLVALVGASPVAWGLLPFILLALGSLYIALMHSYRRGLREDLLLWPDLITVERTEPNGTHHRWHANPYWVDVRLHQKAKIENYLTLRGNGREIELGAFLSPDERVSLRDRLAEKLAGL